RAVGTGWPAIPRAAPLLSGNSVSQSQQGLSPARDWTARRLPVPRLHEPESLAIAQHAVRESPEGEVKHFGIISPPVSGHLHPFGALGRELQARGHRVTCFHMLDVEDKVRAQGMDFEPIGLKDHPRGSLPESLKELGALK